jgi:hypothetical protein
LLLTAQREPEERKLSYLAKLIAFIAFDPSIDFGQARQLLRFAQEAAAVASRTKVTEKLPGS